MKTKTIMKRIASLTCVLFATLAMNAFGQDGYVNFAAGGHTVYDEFNTPGTGVVAPSDVTVTFLWALVGTPDPLGSGVPTNGVVNVGSAWSTVSTMLSSGWTVAQDAGNGNAEPDYAVIASGPAKGSFGYGSFQLANTTGGDTYQLVVIGWDNLTGANTLEQGMTGVVPVGWSSSFDYWTGAQVIDPTLTFNQSGMVPFGVAADPVPEPATLALAGLGGLATFFLRRRIS
jgi:hypothetical protein